MNILNKNRLLHPVFIYLALFVLGFFVLPRHNIIRAQGIPPSDFKIAVIGDSGASTNFQSVLNLIKAEGANMVIHSGDFAYDDGVDNWKNMINNTLGADFPYLGSDGNHDDWSADYAPFFQDRMSKMGITPPSTLDSNYSLVYSNIRFVFTQEGGNSSYIASQLSSDNNLWKICSWHKNMTAMQVGGKGDDQGWGDYEECRKAGALIFTGHEHAYERTKTLTSMQNQTLDTTCSDPNNVCVSPGRTFAVVSGIAGRSIRNQDRCLPSAYPYGCNGEWANIYTSDQGANYGALFITLRYQGDPNKANGYFKNIDGIAVDKFDITNGQGAGGPTPTPSFDSPPPPADCPAKSQGDADCNGSIDLVDYDYYRRIVLLDSSVPPNISADFNGDGEVGVLDGTILVQTLNLTPSVPATGGGNPPTGTPAAPTPTSGGGPAFTVAPAVGNGIWISKEELASLPTSGSAWNNLKSAADSSVGNTSLSARNSANTITLAKALVFARTGEEKYRTEVINIVMGIIGTENGDALAVYRRLGSFVSAADLVGLPTDQDTTFRNWLKTILTKKLNDGRGVASTHETRPNNWGTHAGATRAAIAAYLNDKTELDRTASVFKGWLGDRSSYAGFKYGDLSWQCDSNNPVGINPPGCTKQGHNIDGVLPDDQRRCGSFTWPPCKTNYEWGGLQGVLEQAVILYRAGYDVWNWQDKAILRAVQWLYETTFADGRNYPAEGDDTWQPWIINYYYGTNFSASSPSRAGKNVGWTDWTHKR